MLTQTSPALMVAHWAELTWRQHWRGYEHSW